MKFNKKTDNKQLEYSYKIAYNVYIYCKGRQMHTI